MAGGFCIIHQDPGLCIAEIYVWVFSFHLSLWLDIPHLGGGSGWRSHGEGIVDCTTCSSFTSSSFIPDQLVADSSVPNAP